MMTFSDSQASKPTRLRRLWAWLQALWYLGPRATWNLFLMMDRARREQGQGLYLFSVSREHET